jgi:TolA-binding protein
LATRPPERCRTIWRRLAAVAAACALLAPAGRAAADAVDELAKRITTLEGQALDVERAIQPPKKSDKSSDLADRRLIEAQVAYGVGNYADATIILYDIVEKYPESKAYDEAVFYLADSLFKKRDDLTARDYFTRIVNEFGARDPHYQEALQRLIELSIRLQDDAKVPDYLAKIDAIPQAKRLDSVPYVRGKYLFFAKDYDAALKSFDGIGKTSQYYFQARYFAGTTNVAKDELAAAAKVFHALIRTPAKTKAQKRIVDLAHLALGRIHYERDQTTEAVDHYLMIGRKSDLFDEALYEVAFVYVKGKQFDKALRALELLALANPTSAMVPEVRLLEGNLRIRKAQAVAKVNGGNSAEEYSKALDVFEKTRKTYEKPKAELEKVMKEHGDAKRFFAQITGASMDALDIEIQLPEVAVSWVKQEKDVGRVVNLTVTLDGIREDLDDSTKLLDRIDKAVNSPSRVAIFPELADRRAQMNDISETIFSVRNQLATHERVVVLKYLQGDEANVLADAQEKRRTLADKLAKMPNSADSYAERVKKAKLVYDQVDKRAAEIEVYVNTLTAEVVALEKYYRDVPEAQKIIAPDVYEQQIKELRGMILELRTELDAIRQEVAQASDEAGIGDELAREEASLRKQLMDAVKAEHDAMQKVAQRMTGGDRSKVDQIAKVMDKASRIEDIMARTNKKIDKILDQQLAEVKSTITDERIRIAEYRATLAAYENENVDIGSEIIYGSFDAVTRKFYEIAVRADVGLLDVTWSRKEEAEDKAERMRLDFANEKNIIDAEFRDVNGGDE